MDTRREPPYPSRPRTYVHRFLLTLALLLPACLNQNALDEAFCDESEPCFEDDTLVCGGVERCDNPCFTGWSCDGAECRAESYSDDFDDGNKCTIEECSPAGWIHRMPTAEELDDGDPCTLDECDPGLGITHTNTCG